MSTQMGTSGNLPFYFYFWVYFILFYFTLFYFTLLCFVYISSLFDLSVYIFFIFFSFFLFLFLSFSFSFSFLLFLLSSMVIYYKNALSRFRTCDPGVISTMLYRLSYESLSSVIDTRCI